MISFIENFANSFDQSSMNDFPDIADYESIESSTNVNMPSIPQFVSSNSACSLASGIKDHSPKPSHTDACTDYSNCVIDEQLINPSSNVNNIKQSLPFLVGENIVFKEKYGCLIHGEIMKINNGRCKISFPIKVQMHERGIIWVPFQEIQVS